VVKTLLVSIFRWTKREKPDGGGEGGVPAAPEEEPKPLKKLYVDPYWNAVGTWGKEQDDFIGDPNGEPYVVQVHSGSWIPLSVVVFAASEADAIERVTRGVRMIVAKHHGKYEEAKAAYDQWHTSRTETDLDIYIGLSRHAHGVLDLIENGDVWAEPFDKRHLAKAIWACNDYLA
jgi:hypothetical protein